MMSNLIEEKLSQEIGEASMKHRPPEQKIAAPGPGDRDWSELWQILGFRWPKQRSQQAV